MNDSGNFESAPSRTHLQSVERRLSRLERQSEILLRIAKAGIYESWRRRLRPRLWDIAQYRSRRIRIPAQYHLEHAPDNPPRIAVVTPSYNQGNLIGATVNSVLMQNYPNLAYVVQDGASTDNTKKVLEAYGSSIDWRSE